MSHRPNAAASALEPPSSGVSRLPPTGTLQQAYLHAGHMVISREPCRVTTVLGSCVAVGLWDPTSGIGGVNHFLLPHGSDPEDPFLETVWWVNQELLHHGAEIALLRDLYRLRHAGA